MKPRETSETENSDARSHLHDRISESLGVFNSFNKKCGLFNEGSEQDGLPLKVRERIAFQEEPGGGPIRNGTEHNNNSKAFRKGGLKIQVCGRATNAKV